MGWFDMKKSKLALLITLATFAYAGAAQYGAVSIETVKATKKVQGKDVEYEKKIAVIDGESYETIDIPEDVVVDSVIYNRAFEAGVTATIMLPFDIDTWRVKNATCYKYVKVTKDWDGNEYVKAPWVLYINHVYPQVLEANTPYIIIPQKTVDKLEFDISNNRPTVTLNTTTNSKEVEYGDKYARWIFRGSYEFKQWNEGDPDLGKVYGFAARNINEIKAGEFVKGKAGIKIRPMRAYLKYLPPIAAAKSANMEFAAITEEELPETIEVRLLTDDSTEVKVDSTETTSIHFGTLNTRTGKITVSEWVDLKGRKLDLKPTTKGTYYHNGQKVIIK